MSGLAAKVDVKNMMKGDEKDTTGKKESKKEKAIAKGLKETTTDNERIDKKNKKDNTNSSINVEGNVHDQDLSGNGIKLKARIKVDLKDLTAMSELLEDNN